MIKKGKRKKSSKPLKVLKKVADKEWSLKVRERDGFACQIRGCGRKPAFAHHIFSRRHTATRWDLDNGFSICWGHHRKGHVDPEWLRDEIIAKIGIEKFEELKSKAMKICHTKNFGKEIDE